MADTNQNTPIDPGEYKKVTEAMYKQNLELARLYKEVDSLNHQRESLMHLINHKVKGAFTHSKYIFAGLLDGTFGEVSPEVKKFAEQGLESDNMGIATINLFLNAANMQKGLIKYDMKKIDFQDLVIKSLEEKKVGAESKGLALESNIKDGNYMVTGDKIWLKEVLNNLLENAIKYSVKGKIEVNLENKDNKILLSVKDTGIGITEEDKKKLFTEGGRGKDSVKVNIDSTGYGLYTVKLIIEAHKGRVWAESEGPGKGSTFFMELDAI
ncbi:MAG TPA: HAMP domain-containing sensor histidine kinase [Candidatus Paceibacterota bacterium]|jgi:signal transduction histidine kinase|nr:HAMP domain-containing sensor histidine kinase [Candidatus Paceibacterota bacterium]